MATESSGALGGGNRIVAKDSIMSLSNLTMTSTSMTFGLKPPPPLTTARFLDTTTPDIVVNNSNNDSREGSTASSTTGSEHHHHQPTTTVAASNNLVASAMPSSPRKSVEFILHPPPAKRSKLDTAWTAKQVVDGKYLE